MKKKSNWLRLLPYLLKEWLSLSKGLLCILGFVLVTLSLPHLAGKVSLYIGQGRLQEVTYWLGLGALAFLIRGIFQYGQNIFMINASLEMVLTVRKKTYAHLHKLGLDYFETSSTGDLTYRLTEDIDKIGEIVDKLSHQFVSNVLQLIVIPLYMLYLNWQLTIASLVLAPLMAVLVSSFGERLLVLSSRSQSRISNLSSLLTEVFSGISVVQAFAAQDYEVERFSQEARHNRNARYKTEKLKATQYPIVGFLEAVSIMFLFFIGGWQISQGNLKSEDFVSYLAAVAILLQPIDLITSNYNEFKQAEASVDRIFELIDVQPAIEQKKDSLNLPIVLGKVELSEVSFYYKQDKQVLKNVNLLVKPGQVIALVGASGAGKTTLVKLISRFYDPQKGKISIDDIDIIDLDIVSLRRQIGIVPQENILFSGTIAQNIAYGQDQLDFKAIEKASQIANAHSFIMQFPQGYHTWVGERGVNLSGGQKQRIAIARAVMLNPRIMILDEATSALDSSSEALVQEALERVMENRTVFVVAHRLSTIRNADCIVVLEDGQIVESGNHDQLLVKKGHYAKFYEQQYAKRLDQF